MASGGGPTGVAFFLVNHGENGKDFPPLSGGTASQDHFRHIFGRLGFEVKDEITLFENVRVNKWNHKRNQDHSADTPSDRCCSLCHMKSIDYSDVEYFLFGIFTHGGEKDGHSYVQFFDGECIWVNEIMAEMSDKNFPGLEGKTRILLIDACRNDLENKERAIDRGVIVQCQSVNHSHSTDAVPPDQALWSALVAQSLVNSADPDETAPAGAVSSGSSLFTDEQQLVLPTGSPLSPLGAHNGQFPNFLMVFSTTPGRGALCKSDGSWCLTSLRKAIDKYKHEGNINLFHVLTRAADIMSKMESKSSDDRKAGRKSILCLSSTLTNLPMLRISRVPRIPQIPEKALSTPDFL